MSFTAFNVACIVTAVVSIQMLRMGLVNHTSDGHIFQKSVTDVPIIASLSLASTECFICLLSLIASWCLGVDARRNIEHKRTGTFHVQLLSEKELLVITTRAPGKYLRERVCASST